MLHDFLDPIANVLKLKGMRTDIGTVIAERGRNIYVVTAVRSQAGSVAHCLNRNGDNPPQRHTQLFETSVHQAASTGIH